MNNIRDYISLTERSYSYRIKTILPLDDVLMDVIEKVILRYDPFDISNPKKTIFQANPLDFANVPGGAEVYIVDLTLGLPVSPSVLHRALCDALKVPDKFLLVRGANDPIENETQRLDAEAEIAATAEKEGLETEALLLDPNYKEAPEIDAADLYGNSYNTRFLNYLKKVSDERKKKVEPIKTPLFNFITPPVAETENYNDGLQTDNEVKGDNPASAYRSIQGNYDSDHATYRRVFKKKNGEETVVQKATNPIRKGK